MPTNVTKMRKHPSKGEQNAKGLHFSGPRHSGDSTGRGRHGGWGGISDGYRDLNKQRHRTGKSQSHWGPEISAFYMGIRKGLLGTAGPVSPARVGKCA